MSEPESSNAEGLTRRSFLTNTAVVLAGLMLGARVPSVVSQKYLYNKTRRLYAASHYVGYL